MYLLILFIPLLSASISGLFGRNLGEKGVGIFSTSLIGLTSLLS
jgi:NADH:ubiquinone oxidoreductase subunit 5 (subunit L)/multisubunit Na+/H+ antiporter MnhA subunit